MFYVWGITDLERPYVPGVLRARRRVEATGPVAPTRETAERPGDAAAGGTGTHDAPGGEGSAVAAYEQAERRPAERRIATTAREIMSAPVVTLEAEAPIERAVALFHTERFRHVPVTGGSAGALVGILSDRDVLRELARAGADTRQPRDAATVAAIMAPHVLTARPETRVRDVARVLFEERIGAMPIVDDGGALAGIVTRSDILRALTAGAPLEIWV